MYEELKVSHIFIVIRVQSTIYSDNYWLNIPLRSVINRFKMAVVGIEVRIGRFRMRRRRF